MFDDGSSSSLVAKLETTREPDDGNPFAPPTEADLAGISADLSFMLSLS
jgi:hypothetical protein